MRVCLCCTQDLLNARCAPPGPAGDDADIVWQQDVVLAYLLSEPQPCRVVLDNGTVLLEAGMVA